MTSTIPLAKGLNIDKLEFPVFVSEKLDGVPVRIDIAPDGDRDILVGTQSRSAKPLPSVDNLVGDFVTALMEKGVSVDRPMTFVAEVTHKTLTSFKDVGGVVRKKAPQEDLILNFFDFTFQDAADDPFHMRTQMLCNMLAGLGADFRYVQQAKMGREFLDRFLEQPVAESVEGYIARSFNAAWKPNSRHWDYQKIVVDPTVDLRIVGFEEAKSEMGAPLGMVGRVLADYHGTTIGVGPGKLTHEERRTLWDLYSTAGSDLCRPSPLGIATIKYKRDPSYSALRQPTFQHWRPEKEEPSYE